MGASSIAWLIWLFLLGLVGLIADGLTIWVAWRSLRQVNPPTEDSEPPLV